MDFRRHRQDHATLLINGEHRETVTTFTFLGTDISADLSLTPNMKAVVKKAQQRRPFVHVLRKYNLDNNLLMAFYHCSVESRYYHTVWGCSMQASQQKTEKLCRGLLTPHKKA